MLVCLVVAAVAFVFAGMYLFSRKEQIRTETYPPGEESHDVILNPCAGGYHLHCFMIGDSSNDSGELTRIREETDVTLQLVEFNLQKYCDKDIEEEGLRQIESLFADMQKNSHHLIVRFLYDWKGNAWKYEPEHITIIFRHMEQLKTIVTEYKDKIYTMQGLFTGNWGEMNGTRYIGAKNLSALIRHLSDMTDNEIYLSVRTPSQRRTIEKAGTDVVKVGLFNDGILATSQDFGTYGNTGKNTAEYTEPWERNDELAYQNELAKTVPNGGEVLGINHLSDFHNALDQLERMHISYLNLDYDPKTWEKWENTKTEDEWKTAARYIRAHLGYRYLVTDSILKYDRLRKRLNIDVKMKNTGFAPSYFPLRAELVSIANGIETTYEMKGDILSLCGGKESEKTVSLHGEIDGKDIFGKETELYIRLRQNDQKILFANKGQDAQRGVLIGKADGRS